MNAQDLEGAFQRCTKLESLEVPRPGLMSIGNFAFFGCTKLETLKLSESGLSTIGESVFQGAGLSGKLIIPDNVTDIGTAAFLTAHSPYPPA